mgnify:CR=1 FL=1
MRKQFLEIRFRLSDDSKIIEKYNKTEMILICIHKKNKTKIHTQVLKNLRYNSSRGFGQSQTNHLSNFR